MQWSFSWSEESRGEYGPSDIKKLFLIFHKIQKLFIEEGALKMKINNLTLLQWVRYFKHRTNKSIFWFLYRKIGENSIFWACVASLFIFNDREKDYVTKQLEIALAHTCAIIKRHPHKYNLLQDLV